MKSTKNTDIQLCPSSRPEMKQSKIFGIITGTFENPTVKYLKEPITTPNEITTLPLPVAPTEMFRFVAPCVQKKCHHFKEGECGVAKRIVERIPSTEDKQIEIKCSIRPSCRWWKQEGWNACKKCPLIVTDSYGNDSILAKVFLDPE